MKKLYFIGILLGSCLVLKAQTVRRVNADASVTGTNVYNTIQAAHDAANSGDVLIIEPGSVGNLNCIKTLTIYGRGYYLDYNPNYALLPNKGIEPTIGTISISANNVKISGVNASNITINGGVSGVSLTRISGSYIYVNGAASASTSNITISQNYFNYLYITGNASGIVSNVTISNNYIYAYSVNQYSSNTFFNQNVFGLPSGTIYNSILTNNIFNNNVSITSANTINSTYNNNVFTGTSSITAAVGANNIVVANLASLFQSNSGGSPDNVYRPINGTILKTAGLGGGEVGMFGGSTPYVQYGIPAAPAVIKLFNTGFGNSTTPITATVSATSNN